MKIKKIIGVSIIIAFLSCSKEDSLPNLVGDFKDMGILNNYSSFEVDVNSSPVKLKDIPRVAGYGGWANSNFGQTHVIDFRMNDDNTIDVFWIGDNTTANADRHIDRISLDKNNTSPVLSVVIPPVANISGSKFLGFESLGNDNYILGYSQKSNPSDEIDSNAYYTRFDKSGAISYSTYAFGDKEKKYNPGRAGAAIIRHNKNTNAVGLYLGHNARGHQASWVGFFDAVTGDMLKDSKGKNIGSDWFYSHNFDQRMIASGDYFYTLAHGDAYSRDLGFTIWSHTKGIENNELKYFKIPGKSADNNTGTRTGNFIELPNGDIAIAYATEHSRNKRDLKIVIVSGAKSKNPVVTKENWVTRLTGEDFVGWGISLAKYGDDKILLAWNTFKNSNTPTGSFFALSDFSGNIISKTEKMDETLIYPNQEILVTKDGKKLIFVSAGSGNKLKVNIVEVK